MIYKVEYNKHKYQDCSDNAKVTSKLIPATSPEEAGYKLADMRTDNDIYGLLTPKGNRYYIGIIHFNSICLA